MVTNYIQELLATNNRVIVPNYGAFLVRATSKGKDSNKLEEKLGDVYFSPFLKFNDELLERFIIKKEGITKDQAAGKIKDFIEEIKLKLNSDSVFDIKDFGQFTMDKQGKVVFTPVSEAKEPVAVDKPRETAKKEPKKPTAKTSKEPAKKPSAKAKTTKETEKILVVETNQEPEPIKAEIKPEIIVEEKTIIKTEMKAPVTVSKTEIKHSQPKKTTTVNKGLVWSIAIGIPLAAIFIWALLNVGTIKKVINREKKQEAKVEKTITTKPVKETTEIVAEAAIPAENMQQKTTSPVTQNSNKTYDLQKKYYIIAGSFKSQQYADSYLKTLQDKGFPAERLAERNGMYAVSFNSFTDKTQALAEYKIITREKGLTAWILYY